MKLSEFGPRCLLVAATCVLSVPLLFAQGGGSTGVSTGSRQGGGSASSSAGTAPAGAESLGQQPIFIQGTVVLDDGTPPPANTVIEHRCPGSRSPEAYTDSRGSFAFQIGGFRTTMSDASHSGLGSIYDPPDAERSSTMSRIGAGRSELVGCDIRAVLSGYRSDVVDLSSRRPFDNPNVGSIVLHRLTGVEGTTISATTLAAPKKAKKAFDNGMKAVSKEKWNNAEKELLKALAEYPEYALAWRALGIVHEAKGRPAEARKAYHKALEADGRFVPPYMNLAMMAVREGNWSEVIDSTAQVLRLNPIEFPEAYFFNAVANFNMQNMEGAEKSAREIIKLNAQQRFPQVEHILGLALARQGNYKEAHEHLTAYLELSPAASNAEVTRTRILQLEQAIELASGEQQ